MKYSCVIFDLYNTLIEDHGLTEREQYRLDSVYSVLEKNQYPVSHKQVAEAYGRLLVQMGEFQSDTGKVCTPFEQIDLLLKTLNVSDKVIFKKIYELYIDAALQISPKPMKNAKKALEFLKEHNVSIGLISNTGKTPGVILRMLLKEFDLYDFFDDMVFSDEFGFAKPDPEIFKMAIRRLGVNPTQTIFIGDLKVHDYDGAVNAGLNAHLFSSTQEDLFQLALKYTN